MCLDKLPRVALVNELELNPWPSNHRFDALTTMPVSHAQTGRWKKLNKLTRLKQYQDHFDSGIIYNQ